MTGLRVAAAATDGHRLAVDTAIVAAMATAVGTAVGTAVDTVGAGGPPQDAGGPTPGRHPDDEDGRARARDHALDKERAIA